MRQYKNVLQIVFNCYQYSLRATHLPLPPVWLLLPLCPGHSEHGHRTHQQIQAHSHGHYHDVDHDVEQDSLRYKLMLMFTLLPKSEEIIWSMLEKIYLYLL